MSSFANKYRFTNGNKLPPLVVEHTPPPRIAKNDNNFVPTKYGQELPNAVRAYLPRKISDTAVVIDIHSVDDFPALPSIQKK